MRRKLLLLIVLAINLTVFAKVKVEIDNLFYLLDKAKKEATVTHSWEAKKGSDLVSRRVYFPNYIDGKKETAMKTAFEPFPNSIYEKEVKQYSKKKIEIPQTVTYQGIAYTVTTIDAKIVATNKDKKLLSIEIPSTVTKINQFAFISCNSLQEINVKEENQNYASINGVLYNKEKTALIFVPEGKEGSLKLSDEVSSFPLKSFVFAKKTTAYEVSEKNPYYSSKEGLLYNKEKTILIAVPRNKKKAIHFADGLKEIGPAAFALQTNYKKINLPKTVEKIDFLAFFINSNLTQISIPKQVSTIGNLAFQSCIQLKKVILPKELKELGSYCFSGCSSLTSIKVPTAISTIYEGTFMSCKQLKKVSLPAQLAKIERSAFMNCKNLEEITIPKTAKVNFSAFAMCPKIKK